MDETTDVWAKLGAQLKKARGSRTQKEISDKLNAAMGTSHHPTVITKIENGKRPLNFVEAIHLARILHIDPDALVETIGARDETAEWDEIHMQARGLDYDSSAMLEAIDRLGNKLGQILKSPPSSASTEWVAICREHGEKNLEQLREAYTYVKGASSKLGSVALDTDRRGWVTAEEMSEIYEREEERQSEILSTFSETPDGSA